MVVSVKTWHHKHLLKQLRTLGQCIEVPCLKNSRNALPLSEVPWATVLVLDWSAYQHENHRDKDICRWCNEVKRTQEGCPLSTQNKVNKGTYNGTLFMVLREKQRRYRQLGSTLNTRWNKIIMSTFWCWPCQNGSLDKWVKAHYGGANLDTFMTCASSLHLQNVLHLILVLLWCLGFIFWFSQIFMVHIILFVWVYGPKKFGNCTCAHYMPFLCKLSFQWTF